jgi:osmotically-inducible protein OsmY
MRLLFLTGALLCALLVSCRTNESPAGQINDLEIATQVKSKLASEVATSTLANISVDSTNGVVTLSGQVDTAEQKAKAETVVKSIPKVVRVVNNLQITPRPSTE